jgi:hypothetical protein
MTGHGAKFPRKMEAAIAALLSRPSIDDAARVVDVEPKTLRRWMRVPEFSAAYLQARREALGQALARMQQGSGAAGTTILKLMLDPTAPPAVRLRAAECVFDHAIKGIELEDIELRVSELERVAESKSTRR